MLPRKGAPGKGASGKTDSFSYTRVQTGLKNTFSAFLAGDPYWSLAHEHTQKTPGTKPCLQFLTDGAVRCPRCRPQTCPTWIGWVPLYREADHWPILVIVHESAMDLLHGLSYPAHVLVGRVDDNSGVFVKRSDSALSFRTENAQRQRPRDISADLLTMWGLPELEEWLMSQGRGARPAPLKSTGEPFGPMTQAAAQKYTPPDDQGGAREASYDAVLDRLKNDAAKLAPATNGKHKPK